MGGGRYIIRNITYHIHVNTFYRNMYLGCIKKSRVADWFPNIVSKMYQKLNIISKWPRNDQHQMPRGEATLVSYSRTRDPRILNRSTIYTASFCDIFFWVFEFLGVPPCHHISRVRPNFYLQCISHPEFDCHPDISLFRQYFGQCSGWTHPKAINWHHTNR